MPQAAKAALKDLAPATMEFAQFDLEGMKFVRHYIAVDGSYAGNNYGNQNIAYKEHTYDPDHEMILVNFKREGKDDVMLVNWAAHPANPYDKAIGNFNICADHPGWCRDKLEELIGDGTKVAYFNGASGDLDFYSFIPEVNHGLNAKEYGEKLADYAFEHINELQPLEIDAVKTAQQVVTCNVEHELEHLLVQCMEVVNVRWTQNDRKRGTQMAKDLGLSSAYHANAIISRSSMGATEQRTLNVFRIGPVSFTTGTYEMFSDQGLFVKENSPFSTNFIITGCSGYIPSEETYAYRSYEADTGFYARGTAEKLAETYVEMLGKL